MATQLQFSRRAYEDTSSNTSRRGSVSSSVWNDAPRHVAFAVQSAVPSPQLYDRQRRQYEREVDGHESKNPLLVAQNHQGVKRDHQPKQRMDAVQPVVIAKSQRAWSVKAPTKARKKPAPPPSTHVVPRRKPGWDTDVRAPAAVFDATLKKSALFQPRAGDRQREVREEDQRPSSRQPPNTKPRVKSSMSAWNARIASSRPTRLPTRRPKDFVKMNMERITGQRFETLRTRAQASALQTRSRGSVFERLAASTLSKSAPRVRTPSPTRQHMQTAVIRGDDDSNTQVFNSTKLTVASPVTVRTQAKLEPSASYRTRSPRSVRASPNQERGSSLRSPTRLSTPRSHVSSPGLRLDPGHREPEQPSMAAQVFEVLDAERRGRIGISQILDGLRLLRLPATHNQVSDYVYLIHEGSISTIDLEEWIILVGTLDAASLPQPGSAASQAPSVPSRSPPPSRNSLPRSVNQRRSSPRASPKLMRPSPGRKAEERAIASGEAQDDPDDWYMHAIQRRVDEMYERAEQVVAQRHASGDSKQILERAASAVYQLKSSLYPLVEQAEAMLKDVTQHQSSKLSVRVAPNDLSRIARESEDLAELLFEDILLDTVQELNKEEQLLSQQRLRTKHADMLDEILLQIQQLEIAEDEMINEHFTLAYAKEDDAAQVAQALSIAPTPSILSSKPMGPVNPLTLPLGVVMDLTVNDAAFLDPSEADGRSHKPSSLMIDSVEEDSFPEHVSTKPKPSMAVLGGQLFQRIEKNRVRFLNHRHLVESSLEATGMDQASVIEMLTDLLLDDISTECALELEGGVGALTDALAETLV